MMSLPISILYVISALFFTLGLKQMSSPATAVKGNATSALGMLLAIIATLIGQQIIQFEYILVGVLIGGVLGIVMSRGVKMTSMPQMVALLNGFGGVSSVLLAFGFFFSNSQVGILNSSTTVLSVIIGCITFTGSLVAWAKLSQLFWSQAVSFPLQNVINILVVVACIVCSVAFVIAQQMGGVVLFNQGTANFYLYVLSALALLLGLLSVMSIGGGDMPVVISLLNSYSGLAACAAGFVIDNVLLIIVGSLVGASGFILTSIMCKSMNRSLFNVLFSGFGSVKSKVSQKEIDGEVQPISTEDAYYVLEAARSVVVVPGYGMAVAQAQHVIYELKAVLEKNDCEVKFAIHPVAGRMPGHMNVLLAEANVPYEQLVEMDDINPTLDSVDICLVVGANDVVNPDAKDNESSPIYGMPIIEVSKASHVFVLKRSMNKGFAGIENPLFYKENTRMLFGDAKDSVSSLITQLKG